MSWVLGDHRFAGETAFSVGVEEELMVVDPKTLCLSADSTRLLDQLGHDGDVKTEIFAAEIEFLSPPSRTVADALDALTRLRSEAVAAGASLIASGTHPAGRFGDAPLQSAPRYSAVEDALRGVLRTPTCALHVHVGMPDPATAIRVANAMRVHVPLINALGANSPYWHGIDSGLASARTAILRSYPRSEMPRAFKSWSEFCEAADELARAARVEDYTYFWWDVRPHPKLGTVEVRSPDVQCTPWRTAAITALIQSLAWFEAHDPTCVLPTREALAEYAFAANRYGLDTELPDRNGGLRPARELALETLDSLEACAVELGCAGELDGIRAIALEGNGANRQREAFSLGGMPALLRRLRDETMDVNQPAPC